MTKSINWLTYFNFFLYYFYRKKESDPHHASMIAAPAIISINASTILASWFYIFRINMGNYLSLLLTFFVLLLVLAFIINYVYVYRVVNYKELFAYYDSHKDDFKGWFKGVKIFLITSIIALFGIVILADLRNHNYYNLFD